jgi:predicted dehydrogenase
LRAFGQDVGATTLGTREDADVEFVVVATPNSRHMEDLQWALDRGLHVFVEKPLGATRRDLERARELSSNNSVVMVACNLRFTEGFRCLERNLSGAGELLSVQAAFGWYLPAWRAGQDYRLTYSANHEMGGGIILDAIHEIDYVADLAGPVVDIAATWTNTGTLEIDVEDLAELTLRHKTGVVSHIHLDYLQRTYTRWCRLIGSEATLHWDYPTGNVQLHGPDASYVLLENADRDDNQMYLAEVQHFIDAVVNGTRVENDLDTAIASLEVAVAARERGSA